MNSVFLFIKKGNVMYKNYLKYMGLMVLLSTSLYASSPSFGGISAPIVEYDFANNFNDNKSGSSIDVFGSSARSIGGTTYCNATSSFSGDVEGSYWTWDSGTCRSGGGFTLDVNRDISET